MDNSTEIVKLILENWQIVFIYIFKYLNDISKTMTELKIDIHVLKYANSIKDNQAEIVLK